MYVKISIFDHISKNTQNFAQKSTGYSSFFSTSMKLSAFFIAVFPEILKYYIPVS